jgi:uncharacterized protein
MNIQKMPLADCRKFIAGAGLGRLGCAKDNQPYVLPIYFVYQNDRVYAFSTLGRKIEIMRANPLVCLEVDEIRSQHEWTSVVINGRFEELRDTPEYKDERETAQLLIEQRALWWQPAFVTARVRELGEAAPIFFIIHVDEITGYRVMPDAAEIPPSSTGR